VAKGCNALVFFMDDPLSCILCKVGTLALDGWAATSVIRPPSHAQLKDGVPSKELRERLALDDIILILQQNRL